MKRSCAFGLAVVLCALWSVHSAEAATLSQESLRSYIQRIGANIDSSKGGLFVTSIKSGKARVEIRVLNDAAKQRLGLYAYGFGNVGQSKDALATYEYLMEANSELGIGSFFVDKDKDIGYKFLLDTRDPLSFDTFSIIYMAMANVIAERRPEIAKMLTGVAPAEKSDEATPEDSGESPATGPEPPHTRFDAR